MDSFWIDFALRVGFVLVTICGFCVSDFCRGLLWLTVAVLLDYVVCGCGVLLGIGSSGVCLASGFGGFL